jgi:hypothetical protein
MFSLEPSRMRSPSIAAARSCDYTKCYLARSARFSQSMAIEKGGPRKASTDSPLKADG